MLFYFHFVAVSEKPKYLLYRLQFMLIDAFGVFMETQIGNEAFVMEVSWIIDGNARKWEFITQPIVCSTLIQ